MVEVGRDLTHRQKLFQKAQVTVGEIASPEELSSNGGVTLSSLGAFPRTLRPAPPPDTYA